jgi:hypothetical protein
MKTPSLKRLLTWTLAAAVCAARLPAGDPAAREVKLPQSHVEAVNFTNMTFTVTMKETNLTVRITCETRFFLHGKPAVSKDLEAADHVSGTLRQPAEGPPEAVRIHIKKLAPK